LTGSKVINIERYDRSRLHILIDGRLIDMTISNSTHRLICGILRKRVEKKSQIIQEYMLQRML